MTTGQRIGVAISTTGDEHRLGFLETCVAAWDQALKPHDILIVTVDGSPEEASRVAEVVGSLVDVYRVGQQTNYPDEARDHQRMGVAVNKNTGLELLMATQAEHLFLCDDDTYPLYDRSLDKHIDMRLQHSMLCWGKSRLKGVLGNEAFWSWPRGVVLYAAREVVDRVGGMDERFGIGGHEHVEWSQRIYNAGFTPEPFVTPASYATRNGKGASALWHCEDMARPGEGLGELGQRRRAITSVRREHRDWDLIHQIMAEREGSSDFVPFSAHENGRASATLCTNLSGQGVCAVEPESRGSEK